MVTAVVNPQSAAADHSIRVLQQTGGTAQSADLQESADHSVRQLQSLFSNANSAAEQLCSVINEGGAYEVFTTLREELEDLMNQLGLQMAIVSDGWMADRPTSEKLWFDLGRGYLHGELMIQSPVDPVVMCQGNPRVARHLVRSHIDCLWGLHNRLNQRPS